MRRLVPLLILILFCLSAVSCQAPELPAPSPVAASQTASLPPEASPQASIATMRPAHTATPTVLATTTVTGEPAEPTPTQDISTTLDLSFLSALSWETLTVGGESFQQLDGFKLPIARISPSPSAERLVVEVLINEVQFFVARAVIDNNEHWWANSNVYIFSRLFDWLPDDRLLWIDETRSVFLESEGQHIRLNTPAPPIRIQYASAGIAFALTTDSTLWQIDLATDHWEEVSDTDGSEEGFLGSYAGLSRDRSHLFAFQSNRGMWRVPTQIGAGVQRLPSFSETPQVMGSGMSVPPPQQLANTPYWLIPLPFVVEGSLQTLQDSISANGLIVDTQSGAFLRAADLGISAERVLTYYALSPDGKWLIVAATAREDRTDVQHYLIEVTNHLGTPQLLDVPNFGMVVDWHSEPPAVIFQKLEDEALWLLELPAGEANPVRLQGAAQLLAVAPGTIFATGPTGTTQIMQFDAVGTLQRTLDLSAQYTGLQSRAVVAITGLPAAAAASQDGRAVLFTTAENCPSEGAANCTYALIKWPLE